MRIVEKDGAGPYSKAIAGALADKITVLIGGGPSVTPQQVECVRMAHEEGRAACIAINDAYLLAPWADMLYFADAHWRKWHAAGVENRALKLSAQEVAKRFAEFAGQRCTIQTQKDEVQDKSVHVIRNLTYPLHQFRLSRDPKMIGTGRHGGFQTLNIAVLAGAKRIALLGFDARSADDGKTHWFGDHPKNHTPQGYEDFRRSFSAVENDLLEMGVSVVNCSPRSEINSFPKITIEQALAQSLSTDSERAALSA